MPSGLVTVADPILPARSVDDAMEIPATHTVVDANEEFVMKPLHAVLTGSRRIENDDLRQLFLDARTHNGWLDKPVPDIVLREIYDIAKFGPTSMNTQPMRLLFLRTAAAKERLRPHLAPANVDKTMAAPVTAIVGHDLAFHEHLPKLFPHHPNAKGMFEGKLPLIEMTAFRNGSLQGAYLYHRCARARTGLRANVRVRQCWGGRRVFRRHTGQVQFSVQPRLWRSFENLHSLATL